MDSLKQEIKAWEENRNEKSNSVDWRFTTADARIKCFFVTWYGSIGGHKSTKSLSGKRLN